MNYKKQNDQFGNLVAIEKVGANLSIPLDPANTDYKQYLAWLDKGNEPLPADD